MPSRGRSGVSRQPPGLTLEIKIIRQPVAQPNLRTPYKFQSITFHLPIEKGCLPDNAVVDAIPCFGALQAIFSYC